MARMDGRAPDEMREVRLTAGFTKYAGGSVLCECGQTKVLCTAMVEEGVPAFLKNTGKGGWLTAEYAMLPSATQTRKRRENYKNGPDSRSIEISRLIGRSLRCAFDLSSLGERTVYIDCDVLQADGGTRTASITGGYTAAVIALDRLFYGQDVKYLKGPVAAISAGVYKGEPLLDLCYQEDSNVEADFNIVMMMDDFVEIQGTGEQRPIKKAELNALITLGQKGIKELFELQRAARLEARRAYAK